MIIFPRANKIPSSASILTNGAAKRRLRKRWSCPIWMCLAFIPISARKFLKSTAFRWLSRKCAAFAIEIRQDLGLTFQVINLGGGFGIRYVEGDTPLPVAQYVAAITDAI